MYCKNCGAALEDGALFCSSCGQKCPAENDVQQTVAPNAQTSYPTNEAMSSNYPNNNAMSSNYPNNNAMSSNYPNNGAVSSANEQSAPVILQEQPAEEDAVLFNTEDGTPIYPGMEMPVLEEPKKKKKFLKIFIPIVAVIVLLAATALVFGKTIFFAIAPETYVAKLIQNTSDELMLELNQAEENVFGFDVTMDSEMTAGVTMDYKDAYDEFKCDLSVANDPNNEKLLAEGNFENGYGKGSGYAYLDNENAGVMLPGSGSKYLSVPSKDFGSKFKSADGFMTDYMSRDTGDEREDAYKFIQGLDLSYSNIKQAFSTDKDVTKKINKHVANNLIDLLKKSEIDNREKIKYDFEGKTVNAHEITFTVDQTDIRDFMIKTYEAIGDDDEINKAVNYDSLIEIIEKLENENKDSDYKNKVSDYEIKFVEYKSKIVSVSITYTMDTEYKDSDYYDHRDDYDYYSSDYSYNSKNEIAVTISTTNKDKLLNGITINVASEDKTDYKDDERNDYTSESKSEISLTSDWATKRKKKAEDKVSFNIVVSNAYTSDYGDDDSYSYDSEGTIDLVLDFEKEKWELDFDTEYKRSDGDTDKNSFSYDGKCSKDDGFSFTVNEKWKDEKYDYESSNNMTFDEWINDEYDRYRDDYLEYIYYDRFDYDYDSYYDWYYSDSCDIWDVPDHDFENWLYDEHYSYYYDLDEAYDSETHEEEEIVTPVDAYVKLEFTLKNKVDVKSKSGDNNNILSWSEDDFYDFGDAFADEVKK